MPVIRTLKRLAGLAPNDVEAATAALSEVEGELKRAKSDFDFSSASYGARLVEAMGDGDPAKVEADLREKADLVERLTHARAAIAKRLQDAQEAAQRDAESRQWDEAEKLFRARRLALVRVERLAEDFGKAVIAAEQASRDAHAALPVSARYAPHFENLASEIPRLLALATDGRHGGFVGSLLWELRQMPSLVERAEVSARERLAMRPNPPTAPEPPAAA